MELPKVIKHLEINIYQYSNTIMVRCLWNKDGNESY